MSKSKSFSSNIEINAPTSEVWEVITDPQYAKVLGKEFDEGAYVRSDWKLGSKVDFMYESAPDKPANSGKITKLLEGELIHVHYRFYLFWKYSETYLLTGEIGTSNLQIDAGPYGADLDDQKVAWANWLRKVKEISEPDT